MGRSKPRTNKKPPPKPRQPQPATLAANLTNPTLAHPHPHPHPHAHTHTHTSLPYLAPPDPQDPTFSTALHNWSANALGRLDNLPKLTQSQLTALVGAAAGVGEANFLANPSTLPPQSYNPNIPIDLPASLAALFEAKLTLDREKAKLLRMQQELKGHRESESKGKNVLVEEECTCGRSHYPASAHSEEYIDDDEEEYIECEEDCDCDCHSCLEGYEDEHTCGHEHDIDPPKRPLSEDPERLDETVRELFNWIKAVVWTIEQAAIVSGRRNWVQPQ